MNLLYFALALGAGAALSIQVAFNTQLRAAVGTPIQATFISMCVGAVGSLGYALIARYPWPSASALAATPWWGWCGGLLGVFYLAATVVCAPKLGVAVTFGLVIAGQVVTSLTLDHYGLLSLPINLASMQRIAGVILIVVGVVIMGAAK